MTSGIVEQAAFNNALWCEKICAAHGGPGEFHEALWLSRTETPRYYPDVVTLKGAESAPAQTQAISSLIQSTHKSDWTIKDSFRCLALEEIGFLPLFDAEWVAMESPNAAVRRQSVGVQWERVRSEADLIRWEQEWSAFNPDAGKSRVFTPNLLSEPDIRFIFLLSNDSPAGGGILSLGAGVVGLSNLFVSSIDMEAAWRGLARAGATDFPGLALVAYDRGRELAAAHRVGFSTIGPVRIWRRPPNKPS